MDRDNERLRVLKLVESGQISAAEGVRLLEAVERGRSGDHDSESPRWLRIRVEGRGEKVNVNLPLDAVEMIMGLAARFLPQEALDASGSMDPAEIIRLVRSGARGRIVQVETEDQHVEIFVE